MCFSLHILITNYISFVMTSLASSLDSSCGPHLITMKFHIKGKKCRRLCSVYLNYIKWWVISEKHTPCPMAHCDNVQICFLDTVGFKQTYSKSIWVVFSIIWPTLMMDACKFTSLKADFEINQLTLIVCRLGWQLSATFTAELGFLFQNFMTTIWTLHLNTSAFSARKKLC